MVGFLVAGLVIGALARLFKPGKQNLSLLWTLLLGLAGSVVGGVVANLLGTGNIFKLDILGFVVAVIAAFLWITRRIMHIGRQAIALDRVFAGLVAQGVGIWIGFQAFINMGVNLGALPTKGLTLPLMSYGGSAVLMNVVALAVVLRIDYENRVLMRGGRA